MRLPRGELRFCREATVSAGFPYLSRGIAYEKVPSRNRIASEGRFIWNTS